MTDRCRSIFINSKENFSLAKTLQRRRHISYPEDEIIGDYFFPFASVDKGFRNPALDSTTSPEYQFSLVSRTGFESDKFRRDVNSPEFSIRN